MASSESSAIWKDILGRKLEEQRDLLRLQLQAREPIRRLSDMKKGDHLVMRRSLGSLLEYEHHFLCSGIDEISGKPTIIHYFNTARNAIWQLLPTCLGSGSCLEQLGIIQEVALPDGDLIAESDVNPKTKELLNGVKVERVVWPEELRRYSTEEVIGRARKRLGEKYYHLMKNNCESFVMWCLCHLNISLQATPLRMALCEAGIAMIRTLWQGIQQLPKVFVEQFSDDIALLMAKNPTLANSVFSRLPPDFGIGVGMVTIALVEIITAVMDISKEYEKWKDGTLTKSRNEFSTKVFEIAALALCRSGGSIGGMILGQVFVPFPAAGGFLGALVGTFCGHWIGKLLSALGEEALG